MKFNIKPLILALTGFVCGLLVMYMSLLATVRPLGGLSQSRYLNDVATIYRDVEGTLPSNDTNRDVTQCDPALCNDSCLSSPPNRAPCQRQPLTWDGEQKLRRLRVNQSCQRLHRPSLKPADLMNELKDNSNIYIDGIHHVFFCAVPKAACSSWKSALAVLTNKVDNYDSSKLKKVHFNSFMRDIGLLSPSDVSPSHLSFVLDWFTKILVVRHPFERLVSAYRDKFCTYNKWTKHFQFRYGRKIVLLYRGQNVSVESLRRGHDVTFEEFLRFLVDDTVPLHERLNPHWSTYQHLCHPCNIDYDHVIKFESLEEDNAVILKRHFSVANSTAFFPKRNMKMIPSRDLMILYYAKIPLPLIYKIYQFFKDDMEMFGYDLPPEISRRMAVPPQ